MEIKDLVPVVWNAQPVLTSAQLAQAYGSSVERIKDNFNANKKHYIEGVHYFKITGSDLQNLRVGNSDLQISPKTRTLYLWTYKGCVRHCKSINTPQAWAMFDELEKNYFNQSGITPVVAPVSVAKKSDKARVYLFLMNDGTIQIIKIGHSKNIRTRVAAIERKTGLKVVDMYFTPEMPRKDARFVEWASQKKLSPQCVHGEFFSADFVEARAIIDYFVELTTATLPTEYLKFIADN